MNHLKYGVPLLKGEALDNAEEILLTRKSQGENINSAGGALVGEELQNAIIANRDLFAVFRRNTRINYMASDVMTVPRRTSDAVPTFVSEGAQLPGGDMAFDGIGLVAKKMAFINKWGSEVRSDAIPAVATDMMLSWGYGLGIAEDQAGFTGDGTSTYGGIRGLTTLLASGNAGGISAVSGHSTFPAITAADLGALIGALPDFAMQNAAFYVSAFGFGTCFSALGAVAGIATGQAASFARVATYLGFPVHLTSAMPGNVSLTGKVAILFGDLSLSSTLGDRSGSMRVRILTERYADSDQVAYQVSDRLDINNHDAGTATTPGAMVGLIGG